MIETKITTVLELIGQEKELLSDQEDKKKWSDQIKQINEAIDQKDYTYIYDCINGYIHIFTRRMLTKLFRNHRNMIEDHFWKDNIGALKKRYPDIANEIMKNESDNPRLKLREYGLRGKVLSVIDQIEEHDLYTEYDPVDFALQVTKNYCFREYKNIFIWILGCDFDINAINSMIEMIYMNNAHLYVYVASTYVFSLFLHHTARIGILSESRIMYYFEKTVQNFLQDVVKKNNTYVYIGAYSLRDFNEINIIKDFVINNKIENNMDNKKDLDIFLY